MPTYYSHRKKPKFVDKLILRPYQLDPDYLQQTFNWGIALKISIVVFFLILLLCRIAIKTSKDTTRKNEKYNGKRFAQSLKEFLNNATDYSEWRSLFELNLRMRRLRPIYEKAILSSNKQPVCSFEHQHFRGRLIQNSSDVHFDKTFEDVEAVSGDLIDGGSWRPSNCVAKYKVAIIIAYRDREKHLATLLHHLHPILQRQQLDYKIYVSEQVGNGSFNKGILMNTAFMYAINEYDFDCVIFHDTDMILEDDRNLHICQFYPVHMSVAVSTLNYELFYYELVGGVLSMRVSTFLDVNGYSNLFWNWGGEDDEMFYRLRKIGTRIIRPPKDIARYTMAVHNRTRIRTPFVGSMLSWSFQWRMFKDGLNNLPLKIDDVQKFKHHTHLYVDVIPPLPGFE